MYRINEVFYSLQGEGIRAGTANVFVRFTGCNLQCAGKMIGEACQPLCDTEFVAGRNVNLDELGDWISTVLDGRVCKWMIATGGEPAIQLDSQFIDWWHDRDGRVAVETNGTIALPSEIDWITVSPKVAEHAIKQKIAQEVKYVRSYGQAIPKTIVEADHYLISPHFDGQDLDCQTLRWCVDLVRDNPRWRLSVQQHNGWGLL